MWKGNLYDATKGESLKHIAKRIRGDIKALYAKGGFTKEFGATVRVENYRAIRITVRKFPWNSAKVDELRASVKQMLQDIAESYNYDDSRIEVDHFDTRFYLSINFRRSTESH